MRDPKTQARIAGLLYLLLAILGFISIMYVPSQVVVRTDSSQTLSNILSHEGLFRVGIVCNLVSSVFFLTLALTLYNLFKPFDDRWARALLVLVVVQIPVVYVGEGLNVSALMIAKGYLIENLALLQREEIVMLLIKTHDYITMTLEIFWGLWLIPFGVLAIKSTYFPKVLGILLILGGVAYIVESLTFLLLPELSGHVESVVMMVYSISELSTILWLLIIGVRSSALGGKETEPMLG